MTAQWNTSDCTVIGAQGSIQGEAPFWRCHMLVTRWDKPGVVGIVNMQMGGCLSVLEVPRQVFEETVSKGSWCRIDPIPMAPYAEMWLFRPSFPFRDEAIDALLEEGVLLEGPVKDGDTIRAIVRMDTQAEQLLHDWCDRAAKDAITCCALAWPLQTDYEHAFKCARLSFGLCDAADRSGLYLAVLEVTGRESLRDQTMAMLEKTRGFGFIAEVQLFRYKTLADIYKRRCALLER